MTTSAAGTTGATSGSSSNAGALTGGGSGSGTAAGQNAGEKPGNTTTDNQGGKGAASGTTAAQGTQTGGDAGKDANSSTGQGAEDKGKGAQSGAESEFTARLPEGFKADEASLKEYGQHVKQLGLKGEDAQKLVDLHVKALQGFERQRLEGETRQAEQWAEAIKSDKDLGGSNFEKTQADIKRVMAAHGSPELAEFFNKSPYGNFPPLVRLVARLGAAMAEDRIAGTAAGAGGGAKSEEEVLRTRYPEMYGNSPQNE